MYLESNARRKEISSTLEGKERERSVQQGSLGYSVTHLLAALPQLFTALRAVCSRVHRGSPQALHLVTWAASEEA